MANQADKRQQFRFWYPFWGNPSTAPSRPPANSAPRPSPTNQSKLQATTQAPAPPTPPIKRTNSRTPSSSPSPSPSSSSSSQAKQNQLRRVSRIPSSPLPSPSPTQSPSRRSSRLDQVKQNTKDIDAKKSLEASNQQGTKQEEKLFDKEPIEPKAQDPKTIDDKPTSQSSNINSNSNSNVEKENASKDLEKIQPRSITLDPLISDKEPIQQKAQGAEAIDDKPISQASTSNVEKENGSKDLEQIEPKSFPFDPLISHKSKPTETVIPDKNPSETDEQKEPQNHEPKPQLELDMDREENEIIKHGTSEQVPKTEVSETQLGENKQTRNETHQDKSIPDMNHQENEITKDNNSEETETIKEIAKPIQDGNPKETIKDITQPSTSDVHHLDSNNQNKTNNSVNNNNNHSDNENRAERENPLTNNPKRKEKIAASPSSTRTSFQKEIKGGISKLIQKINADNQFNPGSDRGTSIITLAGENKGASMYIGEENEGQTSTFTGSARNGKDEIEIENGEEDSKISANVNSNVQSINNSVLGESKCDTRDPGVHLRYSCRMKTEKMKKREAINSLAS
ncbi:hypothetical protein FCM35_KLT19596 [Carex littledalei]|uniref:Uncharacterized protein n=1 Tax=Carex littledalei TaxID=544730 RepID=A0A833QWQ1_9POAL|nr:hypothetical protein FCM35_KLT19596 [Carex littledalei]